MARRKGKGRRSKKSSIPVAVALPALYPAANELMTRGFTASAAKYIMFDYTGVDGAGEFQSSQVVKTYLPILVGVIIHKGANALGVNKHVRKATLGWLSI